VLPIAAATILLSISGDANTASGWPQFRGPLRDGKSSETGLVRSFGPAGPKELWRLPIGVGFSSISAVSDRLYTMDAEGETEYAVALDAGTGRVLWRVEIGPLFHDANGDGPADTHGRWQTHRPRPGPSRRFRRRRASPSGRCRYRRLRGELPPGRSRPRLVDGDHWWWRSAGGPRAVAALDKRWGRVWTSQEAKVAYSSPVPIDFGGVRQLLFLLQEKLVSLDREGRELWSVPFAPQLEIKPASPVFVAPDLVLVSASYDVGAKVVQLKSEGGALSAEELWSGRQMRSHFNSAVALDGRVTDSTRRRCAPDAATGESRWAKRGLGKGRSSTPTGCSSFSERGCRSSGGDVRGHRELRVAPGPEAPLTPSLSGPSLLRNHLSRRHRLEIVNAAISIWPSRVPVLRATLQEIVAI
jgi:outer membrane protein assembly factor BamB